MAVYNSATEFDQTTLIINQRQQLRATAKGITMIRKLTATAAILAFSAFSVPQAMAGANSHEMSDAMTECVNKMKAEHGDMHKEGAAHHAEIMAACKKKASEAHMEGDHGKSHMEDGHGKGMEMKGDTHY